MVVPANSSPESILASPSAPVGQRAATLVATYKTRRGFRVILTRRPDTLRRHPGQISFPGGMIEPSDLSPLAAAIREAQEEVGLVVPLDLPATPFAPVTTLTSGIVILPFWVRLPRVPRLKATPDEVAEILRVPLVDLLSPGTLRSIPHPRRPNQTTPAYVWHNQVIWGATAQMLDELLRIFPLAQG